MAAIASELPRFSLPARIRRKGVCPDTLSVRVGLADRIAALPGIVTEDHDVTLPCSVDVYLGAPDGSPGKLMPHVLLCNIEAAGVHLYGLSAWDRHQVALRGWGRLKGQGVLLHLPRDMDELDICWTLIQRAYQTMMDDIAVGRSARPNWPYDLPRFSRTALQ